MPVGPSPTPTKNDDFLKRRLDGIIDPVMAGPPPENAIPADLFVVKLLSEADPRIWQDDFREAKRKKVVGLARRTLWRRVPGRELPPNANVLGGRFVYSPKNHGPPTEMAKCAMLRRGSAIRTSLS